MDRTRRRQTSFLTVIVLAAVGPIASQRAKAQLPPQYTATSVAVPVGMAASEGFGINNAGQIVGRAWAVTYRGFAWRNGVITDFGDASESLAISETGLVAGDRAGGFFLWRNGLKTEVDIGAAAFVGGVNDAGQVAGTWFGPGWTSLYSGGHAFLWQDGVLTDLGTLGGTHARALGINAAAQIVGESSTADGEVHAFLWQNGVMSDLGALGGGWSTASAINDRGQIVGTSTTPAGSCQLPDGTMQVGYHAVLWDNGGIRDLQPPGCQFTEAYDINNVGQIVGSIQTCPDSLSPCGPPGAFLYSNGVMTDLNDVVPGLGFWVAAGINDLGQIVADGMEGTYLLNPGPTCPEPFIVEREDGVCRNTSLGSDFNSDGRPDLVWRNYTTGQNIVWFMNDTQRVGAAWLPDIPDPRWRLTAVADFSGDNRPDILWRHAITGDNLLWVLNGVTVQYQLNWPQLADPAWVVFAVADVDGDGRSDVLWRHGVTGERKVWLVVNGFANTNGLAPAFTDGNFRAAGVIDVDRDGVVEIVQRHEINGVNQAVNMYDEVLATLPQVSDPDWLIAATLDFDRDGQGDILWRNLTTGQNLVWHMNGTSIRDAAWLPTIADVQWRTAQQLRHRAPTDVNGDGTPDLLWRNASTGQNALWHMAGTSVIDTHGVPEVTDVGWKLVAVADFNLDSHPDFVWRHGTTGDNVMWFMQGTTVLQTVPLSEVTTPSWTIVGAADFNGDTRMDLLWRNTVTGENVVWFLDIATRIGAASLTSVVDPEWQIAALADVNRDRHPDVIWRHRLTGDNVVWYMSGLNLASSASLPSVPDTTWNLAMATDVDGDDHIDLVWRNTISGANAVWFMKGATVTSTAGIAAVRDVQWQLVK